MNKKTTLIDGKGVGHILATEDVKIVRVRPDGIAEVTADCALEHFEGIVVAKEAREIPGYSDFNGLMKMLKKPLTEAQQKAADKRQEELREEFPFLFREETPETPE